MEQSALRAELLADADGVAQLLRFLEHGGFDGLLHWNLRDPDDAWVSPGFARILGFELGDIDHMASWWRRRVVREDLGPTIAAAERTAADPSVPFDRVVRYHHRDGRTVAVRARGIALRDDEGRPHRFLGLHTDVTEMVETEQALTRANEVLQQFAGTIAHDLRNPLAAATGMLRLVRGAGAAALSDEQRDDLLDQALAACPRRDGRRPWAAPRGLGQPHRTPSRAGEPGGQRLQVRAPRHLAARRRGTRTERARHVAEGTGIGLAAVRVLLAQLGGTITADAGSDGTGTTMRLRLQPVAPAPPS